MNAQHVTSLVALVVLLAPAVAQGQDQQFRITVDTANVRQEPTTSSRVIGQVRRDAVLPVVREIDQWIVVELAVNGRTQHGHVYRSLGVLHTSAAPEPPAPPASPSSPPQPERDPSEPLPVELPPATTVYINPAQTTAKPQIPSPQPSRRFALGGRVGGFSLGMGASMRYWQSDRLGFELQVSRYSVGADESFGGIGVSAQASVTQFAPVVLYRFGETSTDDDVVIRPYVGGGLNIFRTSSSASGSGLGFTYEDSSQKTLMGIQGLGGVQLTFDDLPSLSVSGDLGYYSTGTALGGYSVGGFGISFAAHWHIR